MFLPPAIEAELHRETYIAILNSYLKITGSKRELCNRAKITPNYLSYILKLDRDSYKIPITRLPSPKVAKRIISALSAPYEIKESLFRHMLLASEKRILALKRLEFELLEKPIKLIVSEIGYAHSIATYTSQPEVAKTNYHLVLDLSSSVLRKVPWQEYPIEFTNLCLLIHDTQCVLNRADDALWHAKLASYVLTSCDRPAYSEHAWDIYNALMVNTARAEGIAYRHLAQYREALNCYDRAEKLDMQDNNKSSLKPHIIRDKISSLSKLPRFSITEVENLAEQAERVCEYQNDELSELLIFLNAVSLARAYIKHQNLKDAEKVLRKNYDRMDRIPNAGPLHKVKLLKTYTEYFQATHEIKEQAYFVNQAYNISKLAGLENQIAQIEAEELLVNQQTTDQTLKREY